MKNRLFQQLKQAQHKLEQALKAGSDEGEVLQQSPRWMRLTTWGLMTTAGVSLIWLSFAKTEEIVVAQGILEPVAGVRDIQIPLNGVVDSLNVKEGERVKKGQILLTLDPEATKQKEKTAKKSLELIKEQIRLKEIELGKYLELNRADQDSLGRNLQLSQEIRDRYTQLAAEGATAELQLLEQQNRVEEIRGRLEKSKVDGLRQSAILNQEIQQLLSREAELESQITEHTVALRYQKITSPVDGVVFELLPGGAGYVNRGNQPVLKVVPFDQLLARVEIPSTDIGFVRIGQPVDISIDSFPATDFGVLEGSVVKVGSDALEPEQLNQTYRYPAEIELDSQQLMLRSGQTLPLQVGMSLTANIKLRSVSYLQLLLGSFRDKTDSLRQVNQG